jgi:hypothetical protein
VWTPTKLLVPPQWAESSNPDYDVGFVVLEKHEDQNIQQVLGGDRLGDDLRYQYLVHVTGYPDTRNAPITCVNWTARFSDTQLEFDCFGFVPRKSTILITHRMCLAQAMRLGASRVLFPSRQFPSRCT